MSNSFKVSRDQVDAFFGVLIATAVLLPSAVSLITIGSFLLGWSSHEALLLGLGIGLLLWFIAGACFRRYANAEFAHPSSYCDFKRRLSQLWVQMSIAGANSPFAEAARKEACKQIECIEAALKKTGLPWVMATGYICIWERLHRAEEAIIEAQPAMTAIAGALYDELRLDGSTIPHCKDLLNKLRQATEAMDPSARKYLLEAAGTAVLPLAGAMGEHAVRTGGNADPETLARVALHTVRYTINVFRDERWNTFVVARNRLMRTIILAGLTAYVLLAIAIVMGATPNGIASASAFYLVGATIGLLNRLRRESPTETAVDDYGLSEMRILAMPVVSGLAAIGGVVLVQILPLAASIFAQTPNSTAPLALPTMPSAKDIFDLNNSKILGEFLVAAVFGLTPGLLFNQLQAQAEKYKADLRSSEAPQASRVPGVTTV
jgi:hypothetical protein